MGGRWLENDPMLLALSSISGPPRNEIMLGAYQQKNDSYKSDIKILHKKTMLYAVI